MTVPTDIYADRARLLAHLAEHSSDVFSCSWLASEMSWTEHRTAGVLRSLERTGDVSSHAASFFWQYQQVAS